MVFFTLGAGSSPVEFAPAASGSCALQTVRITLAGEQIEFCAPTSQRFKAVEDDVSVPQVSYAGLDQVNGLAFVAIQATNPGYAPGMGLPVYEAGELAGYRQDVWAGEAARTDRNVSKGPIGNFWGESVPGMQVELTLLTSTGKLQIRSIEWDIEHADHLWSFKISWDTNLKNAAEWQSYSSNFSVAKPGGENSDDTAIDLGAAFLEPKAVAGISILGGPATVLAPAWWSGVCDDGHYYDAANRPYHPVQLTTWLGVSACSTNGGPDYGVSFFPGAWGEFEFECVELVMRFLYLEWGINPFNGNGSTIKDSYPSASMVFYPNDGTHAIVPGDIITEDASDSNSSGHTVVVTGVRIDAATGAGFIDILEQNTGSGGTRSLSVTDWKVDKDSWCFHQTIQGWLHAKANQPDGDLDSTFTPGAGPNDIVSAIAIKSTGRIMIAGDFTRYKSTTINRIARLNIDGSLDTSFNPTGVAMTGDTPHVYALAVYPNGTYQGWGLVGGHFDSYNGQPRNFIARMKSDGSLDTGFVPAAAINGDVYKIVIQADGKILVGGAGILLRLKSDGSLDTSFSGRTDGDVSAMVVQPSDGKIIIGGNFSMVDDTARAGIARLNMNDGSLDTDTSFNVGIGTDARAVNAISLDPDGRVLIGGSFSAYNGTSRNKVARLNSDGSLDTGFDPGSGFSGLTDSVQVILAQTDGRVLVGGSFSSFNGKPLNHFGRLNYNGSLDSYFNESVDGNVQALALQTDGKIIIGGAFTGHVARLLNSIESCFSLTALAVPAAGGTISLNPMSNCPANKYLPGTQVQLSVILNPDYWFMNWSGDASGVDNPLALIMDGNKAVTANLMASPGSFNKIAPADHATGVPSNPALSWESSSGATSYEYCLYTSTTTYSYCSVETPTSHWISSGSATSVTLNDVVPGVAYHWQVRARNQVDTTYALGAHWWTLTSNGIPAVPVTVSPNGVNLIDHQPPFVWNASPGATRYNLVLNSIDPAGEDVDVELEASSFCSNGICSYQLADALPVGSYQFKVSAQKSGSSYSDFSAWRSFDLVLGMKNFLPLIIKAGG